jgi:hypothetical protein
LKTIPGPGHKDYLDGNCFGSGRRYSSVSIPSQRAFYRRCLAAGDPLDDKQCLDLGYDKHKGRHINNRSEDQRWISQRCRKLGRLYQVGIHNKQKGVIK